MFAWHSGWLVVVVVVAAAVDVVVRVVVDDVAKCLSTSVSDVAVEACAARQRKRTSVHFASRDGFWVVSDWDCTDCCYCCCCCCCCSHPRLSLWSESPLLPRQWKCRMDRLPRRYHGQYVVVVVAVDAVGVVVDANDHDDTENECVDEEYSRKARVMRSVDCHHCDSEWWC